MITSNDKYQPIYLYTQSKWWRNREENSHSYIFGISTRRLECKKNVCVEYNKRSSMGVSREFERHVPHVPLTPYNVERLQTKNGDMSGDERR